MRARRSAASCANSSQVRAHAPRLELLEQTLALLMALRAGASWAVEFGGVAVNPGARSSARARAASLLPWVRRDSK